MARKTKKKVPRGGQEISSFLQGHTTWKADTIQNVIAVGRFGNLADVVLLFRADLIVPWIDKDRAAAVIVAAFLNLSWVDEDPFLTLQAADMAAGMMHGDEVKIVCAEVQETMRSPDEAICDDMKHMAPASATRISQWDADRFEADLLEFTRTFDLDEFRAVKTFLHGCEGLTEGA